VSIFKCWFQWTPWTHEIHVCKIQSRI